MIRDLTKLVTVKSQNDLLVLKEGSKLAVSKFAVPNFSVPKTALYGQFLTIIQHRHPCYLLGEATRKRIRETIMKNKKCLYFCCFELPIIYNMKYGYRRLAFFCVLTSFEVYWLILKRLVFWLISRLIGSLLARLMAHRHFVKLIGLFQAYFVSFFMLQSFANFYKKL